MIPDKIENVRKKREREKKRRVARDEISTLEECSLFGQFSISVTRSYY